MDFYCIIIIITIISLIILHPSHTWFLINYSSSFHTITVFFPSLFELFLCYSLQSSGMWHSAVRLVSPPPSQRHIPEDACRQYRHYENLQSLSLPSTDFVYSLFIPSQISSSRFNLSPTSFPMFLQNYLKPYFEILWTNFNPPPSTWSLSAPNVQHEHLFVRPK